MHVALLGLGLIGGSVALALRDREPGRWTVAAWTPSGIGPERAAADGAIDRAAGSVEEAIEGADLVVLAAPPLACLELLDRLAAVQLAAGAVVTDVASTKRRITARAAALDLPFVGGHPMAGRESTGYAAADPDLFVDRPWVICGVPYSAGVGQVEELVRAVGARPVRMDPIRHDAAVSAVSHLPLVVSAALVEAVLGGRTPESPDLSRLAAGGWTSMTRLARGDVEMGAGIVATNADNVASGLRALREVIDEWIAELDAGEPDAEALRRRFAAARALLE